MGNEEYPADFYQGPAYALIIGIRKYKYGKEPGQELEDHEFPYLKVADKDAFDLASFLRTNQFIKYNVTELIDEQAELWKIKDEFETLRKNCKKSEVKNPLVIVYFSGHGWADADGRHYLVPYEARRNKLFATALLNKDFNFCLDQLETNKLVVLIDTCHAGAIGGGGIKGAYDLHQDLTAREGRYVIASCGPNQKSYEWKEKKNSIFTGRLLELLKGETDDFDKSDDPEIDISELFPALRDKVAATAREEYDADQEPISEMGGGEKIVLAISKRILERKQEASDQQTISRFLDLMCNEIKGAAATSLKASIATDLRSFVREQEKVEGFDDFYDVFSEQLGLWKASPVTYRFPVGCKRLINSYKFASEAASASRKPVAQESAQQVDDLVTPDKSLIGFQDRSVISREIGQTIATPPPGLESRPVPFEVGAKPKPHNLFNARIKAGSGERIEPPKVFVSYSRKDQPWLDSFKETLAPLVSNKIIDLWADTDIDAGDKWKEEIDQALDSMKVAVLLVTKHFLSSPFILNNELPRILNGARDKGVKIVWIKVSACMVEETPIFGYQAAHDPKVPLDKLSYPECQEVLSQIGMKIKKLVLGN
ncbi:MAG TPA: caspase family protein [Pyrinomonadaceae bacterium]